MLRIFIDQETLCMKNMNTDVQYSFVMIEYHFSLPWNQSTLLGYSYEICYEMTLAMSFFAVNGLFLIFFISMCLCHNSFYKIFRSLLNQLDDSKTTRESEEALCNLIRFRVSVQE